MGSVGEFESVWRSIEYGSKEKNSYLSKPEILKSLVDGLKTYRPPGGSPEADKIKNNKKLSTVEKSAALRFSALSGLSEEQSMKLYQSNQENINEKLKQQFLDIDMESDCENLLKVILSQMLKILHKDRIYIIKSVDGIINSPEKSMLESKDLTKSLISQLENLLKSSPVPPRSRDLNSEIISAMHLQNLREKCFIVESLLLSVTNFPNQLTDDVIQSIFKLSKKYFFLLNPSSSYLVDSVVADKLKEFSIVLLQLVLIKVTCKMQADKNIELLKKIDKMVLDLLLQSEARILAPFQLAWSMVRFLYASELEDEGHSERLSCLAFQSGIWRISRMILEMPQLKQSCAEPEIAQTILDLADLVLSHVDPESAGGAIELCDTVATCLQSADVADKFWETFEFGQDDDEGGLVSFINQQLRFIPLDLEISFKLLSALSNAGQSGKQKIVNFLNELKCLSEPITGEETEDEIQTDETGSEWTLRKEKAIAGYTVEVCTRGELFQSPIGPIVQWNLKESVEGWNLMELIISGENDNDLTISVLKLYANLESVNAPIYKDGFETLFKRIIANYSHEDYSDILNHFLDTIEHLDIYLTKKVLPGSSLFSEIMSQEREMSSYQNLIKIIKILGSCCKKYHSVLMPCLESVFSEIFGPHLSWKYSCIFQKIELSIALLNLVRSLLSTESKIRNTMIDLFRNSESICRIVLTLSCLNSEEIDDTASTSEKFTSLLIEQVSASFAILEVILTEFQDDKDSKIMKLLTQRTDNDSVCGFILKSVSGFIFLKSNSELPFVAIRLLDRLCFLDQISLNATLGSYVFQLRNNILSKMTENEKLQNHVIKLLATIAVYQPSLLEIFIDLEDDKDSLGEKKIGPNSCLQVILDLLKTSKEGINLTKLESGFRFLHALWAGRKDSHKYFKVLRILRARENFWSSVFIPFYLDVKGDDVKGLLTMAHSFAVISHEYYFATKMNEDFEKKLNQLSSLDDQLIKWSKQVTESIENLCHMDIESPELSEVKEALVSFVKSWRTFWSVFAPGKEITQNQKVQFTLEGIKSCSILIERLSDEPNDEIRSILLLMSSSTLSNLSKISNSLTQEQRNTALDSLFKALKIIQDDTNLIYENTVIIDIMSMISVILKCSTQSSPKIQAILKVSSKFMNTNNDTVQIISSRIIQQTFKILKTNEWLKEISDNNIFQSVTTLLSQVVTARNNHQLGMALCSLLISVSDNPGAMSHFIRLSLLSPLILASENLYLPLTEASENEWPRLYAQLTLLQLQLLKTLGPMYINDALDWTGVHQKRFEYILKIAGRESSSIEVLNEANVVLMFLIKVSDYKDLWIQTVGQGGSSAAECLQATAKLLVTVPRLFNDTKLNNLSADDSQNERISLEYIRILISSFQILSKFSAPIMQILLDEGIDSGQYQNILQPSLQPAQIGEMPTFGSCLSCLSLGVMFLGKTGGEIITKPDIVLLIDQSIQLILSQSSLLFLNSEESRELNQFKNYLGAELSDNILAAQRHFPFFKQNWPISPGASPRASRERTPVRRSKSVNLDRMDGEHGMLLIADQFKKEILN